MTDSLGTVSYTYDQLSQLTAETRAITGVGSFTLNYTYGVRGQLSSITDPFGAQVGYSYDKTGRLSDVTGPNFASVSSYASGLQYRAWGALKSLTYGNAKTVAPGYDSNLNGCILGDVPVPCEMVTNDSATQCPNNQCKRGNRFFRSFSEGYADYVPSDTRYEGHGIARSDSAAAGSLDELAGVVVLAPSQNPAPTPTPTPCPGSIPEDIAKLIESAFTDGLSNPFGTVSQNRFTQEYTDFNGDFEENVIVAARAFSRDILPRSNGMPTRRGGIEDPQIIRDVTTITCERLRVIAGS